MKKQLKSKEVPFVVVDPTELNPAEEAFSERFKGIVIGQPGALRVARMAYSAIHNPLRDPRRPFGVYYLVGPSRTGKSLTAEALAMLIHEDVEALTRIEAGDYESEHEKSDLKGAPPGYVGYRDPKDPKNQLAADEEDPYSIVSPHNMLRARLGSGEEIDIVVIEEFEKSSYDFYKLWMGVFDKGRLKLRNGLTTNFRRTIFVLTSNLGTADIQKIREGGIGFNSQGHDPSPKEIEDIVLKAMKKRFPQEFINRLDAIIAFQAHTAKDIADIVDAEIRIVENRITENMARGSEFGLEVTATARVFLLKQSGNQVAELKRVINTHLMMPLGHLLHPQYPRVHGGDLVRVNHIAGESKLTFEVATGAFQQSDADGFFPFAGDSPETMNGLAFQRRVAKAKRNAGKDKVEEWSVIFTAKSQGELADTARSLMHDLEQVYEVFFDFPSFARRAPWMFTCTVTATEEQIALIRTKYPELSTNKTGRELTERK